MGEMVMKSFRVHRSPGRVCSERGARTSTTFSDDDTRVSTRHDDDICQRLRKLVGDIETREDESIKGKMFFRSPPLPRRIFARNAIYCQTFDEARPARHCMQPFGMLREGGTPFIENNSDLKTA